MSVIMLTIFVCINKKYSIIKIIPRPVVSLSSQEFMLKLANVHRRKQRNNHRPSGPYSTLKRRQTWRCQSNFLYGLAAYIYVLHFQRYQACQWRAGSQSSVFMHIWIFTEHIPTWLVLCHSELSGTMLDIIRYCPSAGCLHTGCRHLLSSSKHITVETFSHYIQAPVATSPSLSPSLPRFLQYGLGITDYVF